MRVCPKCRLRYTDETAYCLVDGAELERVKDPRIGSVLAGRYTISEVLGRGGMATVYKAHHTMGNRVLAIKILHDRFAEDQATRERFHREAERAKTLAHPNIVEVFDFGVTEEQIPFLVMELLDGHPLDQVLKRRRQMRPAEVIALGLQIARGLSRAHDFGIVHRDVKPENIFLCRSDDDVPVIKLVDFGIALAPEDKRLTATGQMLGSPRYMAPERFRDRSIVIPASDLYALGIVLFEMVTGRLPFESESMAGYLVHHMETIPPRLRSVLPSCPPALDDLVAELVAKEPGHRPVDAHAVVAALSNMASESARRVRHVSALATSVRESGVALRLDAWSQRVKTYGEMFDCSWPDGNPPKHLGAKLAELNGAVARLKTLHKQASELERELGLLDKRLKQDLEQVGKAIQALAEDLSKSKVLHRTLSPSASEVGKHADTYRRALAQVIDADMRNPDSPASETLALLRQAVGAYQKWLEAEAQSGGAADLAFQIDALKKRQQTLQDEATAFRTRAQAQLANNGKERATLEDRLVELSQDLSAALGGRPELAELFARLRTGAA